MNITAHQVVARERTVAAPRGPNAVWLPAPPNAPAMSAALPLCSSTTMIRKRQFTTKNVGNSQENQRESISLQPKTIKPSPSPNANAHFIQPGIFNPRESRLRESVAPRVLAGSLERSLQTTLRPSSLRQPVRHPALAAPSIPQYCPA